MFSKDGIEMMDVTTILRDGDRLVLKGKMMGAMNTAIYLRPEDMWQAFRLVPWSVILRIPWILVRGWWRAVHCGTM